MNSIAKLIVDRQNIDEKMDKEGIDCDFLKLMPWLFSLSGFKLSSILKDKYTECVSRCIMNYPLHIVNAL